MILELRSLFCKIGFLMKTLLYLFSLFLFSLSISADDNLGAKIKIQLSPAGSFEISGDISGKATVKDGVYTAKKLKFSTKLCYKFVIASCMLHFQTSFCDKF